MGVLNIRIGALINKNTFAVGGGGEFFAFLPRGFLSKRETTCCLRAESITTFSCQIFVRAFVSLKIAWIFSCGLAVNQL